MNNVTAPEVVEIGTKHGCSQLDALEKRNWYTTGFATAFVPCLVRLLPCVIIGGAGVLVYLHCRSFKHAHVSVSICLAFLLFITIS